MKVYRVTTIQQIVALREFIETATVRLAELNVSTLSYDEVVRSFSEFINVPTMAWVGVVLNERKEPLAIGSGYYIPRKELDRYFRLYFCYDGGKSQSGLKFLMKHFEQFLTEHNYSGYETSTPRLSGSVERCYMEKYGFTEKLALYRKEL